MKAKFGAIVVDGRGKIGGHVASKNRAGAYFRTKVTPVNPQSSAQLNARNRFTNFSQGWSGLTDEQRSAWNAAVVHFARTDIFGDLKNPTGFNLYQRLNNNLAIIGKPALPSPPLPVAVQPVVATNLTAVASPASLSLSFDPEISVVSKVKVFATAPQALGRNYVKSAYRLIGVLGSDDTSPKDITAMYISKFGTLGEPDQRIFVKIEVVAQATGQTGTPSEVSAIVS